MRDPRRFVLVREVDVTGISGTGIVVEGIQFSDGTVACRWVTPGISEINLERGVRPTTVIHESVRSVVALHGHNGATKLVWYDDPLDDDADTVEFVKTYLAMFPEGGSLE